MIRFLQSSRTSARILIGGFLFIVCFMLVITLIPGSQTFGGVEGQAGLVARVGDQDITLREVDEAARRMARQQFPRNLPQQLLPFFRQQAAEQQIGRASCRERV